MRNAHCVKNIVHGALQFAADREANRCGARELREYELTVLPEDGGFILGSAGSENARAFIFGGNGGYIGVIRVKKPLWTLEKQMIGKRCGPFCDVMGIDALCVSCSDAPDLSAVRSKAQNRNFFASPFCDECCDLLKCAWDNRSAGPIDGCGIASVPGSSDLRIILPGAKITKIMFSYRESFETVTDTKTLYYIVKGKIPARLRPSENGAGIIIQKSELRFAADS